MKRAVDLHKITLSNSMNMNNRMVSWAVETITYKIARINTRRPVIEDSKEWFSNKIQTKSLERKISSALWALIARGKRNSKSPVLVVQHSPNNIEYD